MKWHALVVLIYALFILTGGMIGFLKAHSQVSLLIGTITGLLLIASSLGIYNSHTWGLLLAFSMTVLLTFFFGYRFFMKAAFFPSGLMTLLSVATLLFLSFLPKK